MHNSFGSFDRVKGGVNWGWIMVGSNWVKVNFTIIEILIGNGFRNHSFFIYILDFIKKYLFIYILLKLKLYTKYVHFFIAKCRWGVI